MTEPTITGYRYLQTDKAGGVPPDLEDYPIQHDRNMSTLHGLAGQFHVSPRWAGSPIAESPNLTVDVAPGRLWFPDGSFVQKTVFQNVGPIVAPVTDPRWDVVYIPVDTGVPAIKTGVEAGSPVLPALDKDQYPLAYIVATVGMTQITVADINDLRPLAPAGAGGFTFISSVSVSNAAFLTVDGTELTDDFGWYQLFLQNFVPITESNAFLRIELSRNGGSTWDAFDYDHSQIESSESTTVSALAGEHLAATADFNMVSTVGSGVDERCNGLFEIIGGQDAALFPLVRWDLMSRNAATVVRRTAGSLHPTDVGKINGVRFFFSSGNIDTGEAIVLGAPYPTV